MYYLVVRQYGEGCDYTIACGEKYRALSADNLEDAIEEAIEDHYCDCYMDGDQEAEDMLILEVSSVFDLKAHMQEDHDKKVAERKREEALKKKAKLEAELAELNKRL